MQVDPPPDPEELAKRRKLDPTKYIIDPYDVKPKEESRVRQWCAEVMTRHESKLSHKFRDREIIASGEVEPEAIDVRSVYPFKDLRWIIYRAKMNFNIMLLSGPRMLLVSSFAKI